MVAPHNVHHSKTSVFQLLNAISIAMSPARRTISQSDGTLFSVNLLEKFGKLMRQNMEYLQ